MRIDFGKSDPTAGKILTYGPVAINNPEATIQNPTENVRAPID